MADETGMPASLPHSLDRRRLLIGLAMAAGAGVAYARKPTTAIDFLGNRKLDKLIPERIGGWEFLTTSGLVVPTEDPLADGLYSEVVTRVYVNGKDPPVMLLVAQSAGQSGILQIHRPEFCYPAGGFKLSPIEQVPLPVGKGNIAVNKLTATQPGRTEPIIYWTRVGRHMPNSWAQQRIAVASDNMRGYVPDAVLTRLSTIDPNSEAAFKRLTAFGQEMLAAMKANRNILVTT